MNGPLVLSLVVLQKKTLNFRGINLQSMPPLSFLNKPSNFIKINPQFRPYKWAGLTPAQAVYHGPWPYWPEIEFFLLLMIA